jgi:hypothetical protein|tara:strand:- start:7491 stop:8036 length:546 start_codon:yes stop_codon:yes gene_type:complete
MKYLLLVVIVAFSFSSAAADFETSQHNFDFEMNQVSLQVRQMTEQRKDHIQVGYKLKDVKIEYRYVDAKDTEQRFRATYSLFGNKNLSIKPRLEYRLFNDKDSVFRLRNKVVLKHSVKDFVLWIELQPGLTLNDMSIDTQTRTGFNYKMNKNVSFGPFFQLNTNNLDRKSSWIGTNFLIKF